MVLLVNSDKKVPVVSLAKVDHKVFKVFAELADAQVNLEETDCRESEAFQEQMVDLVTQVNKGLKDCLDRLDCLELKVTKELQEVMEKLVRSVLLDREVILARKALLAQLEAQGFRGSPVTVVLKGRQVLEVSK